MPGLTEMLLLENPDELDEEDEGLTEFNPAFADFDYDQPIRNNPQAKRAMKLAGRFRSEGMDSSSALQAAWSQVRGGKKNTMLENPLGKMSPAMLLIAAVVAALVIHRLASGKWAWQGLVAKPALNPGKPRIALSPSPSEGMTPGMQFCDSSYSPIGEPIGNGAEQVGVIFG